MITYIKQYRQQLNLTQAELADQVGVRRETVIFLEQGKYNPSLKLAFKIATIFNTSIENVFELKD